MIQRRWFLVSLACLACSLWSQSVLWAAPFAAESGPTTASPAAPIAVRKENEALLAAAAAIDNKVRIAVAGFADQVKKGQLKTINMAAIGDAYAGSLQLHRLGSQLAIQAEPAGDDMVLRAADLNSQLQQIVQTVKTVPGVGENLGVTLQRNLIPDSQRGSQKLPAIERLTKQDMWDQAEKELYVILDGLETRGVWFNADQRLEVFRPFSIAQKTIDDQLVLTRLKAAKEQLEKLRQEQTPDIDGVLKQIADATGAIGQSGKFDLDGKALSGPEALEHFAQRWRQVQALSLHARALDWGRARATGENVPELEKLDQDRARFDAAIILAMVALIDADAARAMPQEADLLYGEYIKRLAPVASQVQDGALTAPAHAALVRLSEKSPALAANVKAYHAATSDLLRWRRRTAKAYTKAQMDFKPLRDSVVAATPNTAEFPGLLVAGTETEQIQLMLHADAPHIMPGLARLVDQPVIAEDFLGATAPAGKATGRYHQRIYAVIPSAVTALGSYLPILCYDLLVSQPSPDTMPPLSLEAAVALHKARHGDVAAVGGKVTQCKIKGHLPHFVGIDPQETSMHLGPMPLDKTPGDFSRQVVLECEIKPAWLEFEFFFIETPQ